MTAKGLARHPRIAMITRTAAVSLTAAVVVALGVVLHASQATSQRQLSARFEARGQLASSFAATRIAQLLDQESSVAVDSLSGTTRLDEDLAQAADMFDFRAAEVVNSQGRVLAAYPATPGLFGSDLAARYRHIAAALTGHPAVSTVIVSSTRGVEVVEFAVPYYTPNGRRVLSGAYELSRTPLDAFLATVTPVPGSRVYVVDPAGTVVGSSADPKRGNADQTLPPALAAAYKQGPGGNFLSSGGTEFFTRDPIAGTPWSLVLAAPVDSLFAPIRGPQRTVPWIVLGFVALLAGGANWMLLRLLSGRDSLRVLNAALDTSARTDQLTNLPNRRHLDEALTATLSAGDRHRLPVSVLVMDLDHFKQVNDTFGHTTGDRVLEHVARVLETAVRTEDVVGRWGGEEFLAVLPHTDPLGAAQIAERLRRLVQDTPYSDDAADQRIVTTLSIGCATHAANGDKDMVIRDADQASIGPRLRGETAFVLRRPVTTAGPPLPLRASHPRRHSPKPGTGRARPQQRAAEAGPQIARIWLFLASWVTSARPSVSSSGGR